MGKIVIFYWVCSISLMILLGCVDMASIWLYAFLVFPIISPIITFCATLLYIFDINERILSNVIYAVLYSISSFLVIILLSLFKINIEFGYVSIIFIIQNIIIICFCKRNDTNSQEYSIEGISALSGTCITLKTTNYNKTCAINVNVVPLCNKNVFLNDESR